MPRESAGGGSQALAGPCVPPTPTPAGRWPRGYAGQTRSHARSRCPSVRADVGRLSLVDSAACLTLFLGAGERAQSPEKEQTLPCQGEGCPAQSLGARAWAHSPEPKAATTFLIRAWAPQPRQRWRYQGHGFFASP